jgi:hypothetical protein
MTRLLAAMAATLLGCGAAFAQVGGSSPGPSPLGMTSPLGIGPGAPGPAGVRLGATEVPGQFGVSPLTSSTSPLGPTSSFIATCGGIGGSIPQASFGTGTSSAGTSNSTVFDGGSNANTASGTCPTSGGSSLAGPAASASSPTGMGSASSSGGRGGIPLGSTELGGGGLSPMPQILTPNPSAPSPTLGTPCPTTGMSFATAMSSGSC